MNTIFDAMPVKVLEELERIEITIPETGAAGFSGYRPMRRISAAGTMRSSHHGKPGQRGKGLDNLVAERQRLDAIAWISDPLPSGITIGIVRASHDQQA